MYTIGMCVDEAYLLPALVTLTSLAEALPERERAGVAVRVLTTDLPPGRAGTMAAVVRRLGFDSFDIRWDMPAASCQIVHGDHISTTTYLRFHFTKDFVDRPYLIYLDADLLVLDNVSPPLERLAPSQIGLVRDAINHTVGRGPALPGVVARWPALRGRPYFNAGVIWCPADTLPGLRCHTNRIMAGGGHHIHFNDQDALNLWALRFGDVLSVNAAYNTFELDRFREIGDWIHRVAKRGLHSDNPTVLHFVGPDKPWQSTCPTTEAVRLYRRLLRQVGRLVEHVGDLTLGLAPKLVVTG